MTKETRYIHGTTPSEQERLAALNRLTNAPFLDFLRLAPDMSVLEIGSGLGILASAVGARVVDETSTSGELVGVEYSPDQLQAASSNQAGVRFCRGDAHRLPLADGQFDLVYCRYLLEHVREPQRVLAEAFRVLKPLGRCAVQENDILVSALDPECPAFERVWQSFVELQARCGGDARIGRRLHGLFRRAGFEPVTLSIQPEVHWHGSSAFEPWIDNLSGNVQGAAERLIAEGLATGDEISTALDELARFKRCPDAAAWFYWHRAEGIKPGGV